MTKIKSFDGIKSHKKNKKKIVFPMCINPVGTLTGNELKALLEMSKSSTSDFQFYVEDNTTLFNLSLISLAEGKQLEDIDPKQLEDARKNGKPILIKKPDNTCVVYGDQNGRWDFVPFEASDIDLTQFPFEQGILLRQHDLFTPQLVQKLSQVHVPYYLQWVRHNGLVEGRDFKSIHSLKEHTLWQRFHDAFFEYLNQDGVRAQLQGKLDQDKAKVLPAHPDWKETIDEHNLQTALYWAFLHIGETKDNDAVNFILYPHKSSNTGNFITQFASNHFATHGWCMQSTEQVQFDMPTVIKEYDQLMGQKKILTTALEQKEMVQETAKPEIIKLETVKPETVKPETKPSRLGTPPSKRLHPDALFALSSTLSTMAGSGNATQAAALFFIINEQLLDLETLHSSSTAVISRGLSRQEEMKVDAVVSPERVSKMSPKRSSSSSSLSSPMAFYGANYGAAKVCSREESQLSPGVNPRALRVNTGG